MRLLARHRAPGDVRVKHPRFIAPPWVALPLAALLLGLWPALAMANPPRPDWNPGPPWAPLAPHSGEVHEISNLFWIMLILSGIILAGVVAVLVICIVRFSQKEGREEPTQVFGHRGVEIAWTLIPTLILAIAFIATVKAMNDINTPHKGAHILDVDAIGHQWWWEFRYPTLGIDTANEVHVPVGTTVHYHVEAADVLHSFWVPQLQRQIDANPGQDNAVYTALDEPGVYAGDCYEYCGDAHAWMKFRVVVQPRTQFDAWVHHEQQPANYPSSGLAAAGRKVFFSNTCVNCHSIYNPKGQPQASGAVGPNLTHLASRQGFAGWSAPMNEQALMNWVRNPQTYKPNPLMPGYPFLSNKDLRALAAYLYSLK